MIIDENSDDENDISTRYVPDQTENNNKKENQATQRKLVNANDS